MAVMHYDKDAAFEIRDQKVGIIGFGSQGHAHALNLKDSGVEVHVGLKADSRSRKKAEEAGLKVASVAEVAEICDVVMLLAPDTVQPDLYRDHIAPAMRSGKTLMFAHGFNIRYGTIEPPSDIDVTMIAPKGPGHRVRETYVEGGGVPALIAVHQDASGQAKTNALSYAKAIGATRGGVIETTFSEETETDLFGEQVVLCGGISELIKAGFDTLVAAGYQPEVAYFECLHEVKLIVDLIYRGGLGYMRYSVSNTAEYGDYVSGRRVIDDRSRQEMKNILGDIQDGTFAKNWIKENKKGRPEFEARRREEREHPIEKVGQKLRALMPFVDPVEVNPGD